MERNWEKWLHQTLKDTPNYHCFRTGPMLVQLYLFKIFQAWVDVHLDRSIACQFLLRGVECRRSISHMLLAIGWYDLLFPTKQSFGQGPRDDDTWCESSHKFDTSFSQRLFHCKALGHMLHQFDTPCCIDCGGFPTSSIHRCNGCSRKSTFWKSLDVNWDGW